jgi:hypothetical protein
MVIVKVKIAHPKAVWGDLWADLNSYLAVHGEPLEVEQSPAGTFVHVPLGLAAHYRSNYGSAPSYPTEDPA